MTNNPSKHELFLKTFILGGLILGTLITILFGVAYFGYLLLLTEVEVVDEVTGLNIPKPDTVRGTCPIENVTDIQAIPKQYICPRGYAGWDYLVYGFNWSGTFFNGTLRTNWTVLTTVEDMNYFKVKQQHDDIVNASKFNQTLECQYTMPQNTTLTEGDAAMEASMGILLFVSWIALLVALCLGTGSFYGHWREVYESYQRHERDRINGRPSRQSQYSSIPEGQNSLGDDMGL